MHTHGAIGTEAWSLDEATFQGLLGWMASRRSRVVVLSGDVHYGFGARLVYWSRHPYRQAEHPAVETTVVAQLTSSALHNENYASMAPVWDLAARLATTDRLHDPGVLHHVDRLEADTILRLPEDWRYHVEWLQGVKATTVRPPRPYSEIAGSAAAARTALAGFRAEYSEALRDDLGRDIVGRNNVGELVFEWPDGKGKRVHQRLWWTPYTNAPPAPITNHTVSLDPDPEP